MCRLPRLVLSLTAMDSVIMLPTVSIMPHAVQWDIPVKISSTDVSKYQQTRTTSLLWIDPHPLVPKQLFDTKPIFQWHKLIWHLQLNFAATFRYVHMYFVYIFQLFGIICAHLNHSHNWLSNIHFYAKLYSFSIRILRRHTLASCLASWAMKHEKG